MAKPLPLDLPTKQDALVQQDMPTPPELYLLLPITQL